MSSESNKYIEKIMAIILLFAVFIIIPYKILLKGFVPPDDSLRHVAFSITDQKWSDVLLIEPGLEGDHNAGWHQILRSVYKFFRINKEQLFYFSIIFLFLLVNITGSLCSPNVIAWSVALLIMFVFDREILWRFMLGRPYLISCCTTIILLKLWFIESSNNIKWYIKYFLSIFVLTFTVWTHGTWYTFLLLPIALILSGKIKRSLELTIIIFVSTLLGAYLTGQLKDFIYYHHFATLNIFSEKIYNWQLVSEFAEGSNKVMWMVPILFIIILLVYSKKLKLNELCRDPNFILILLTWMLSIKVTRFWIDWGDIVLMFWLSNNISVLILDMKTVKKPIFRYALFVVIIIAICISIPNLKWTTKGIKDYSADFSRKELLAFKPEVGGIIYNDLMSHFYSNYFNNPFANYRFVLGFEPAIMQFANKKVLREITYSGYHYTSYRPWIDKLTKKDRIFTSIDICKNYPELDWVKAGRYLFIGKIRDEK